MMRTVLVLAWVAGCAAPRPATRDTVREDEHVEPDQPTSRIGSTTPQVLVAIARPDLPAFTNRMPDPERDLRWPLSVSAHPGLEPSFAIGPALAQPTVAWTSLCANGAQNRFGGGQLRDLTGYLRAWCAVEAGDFDGGLAQLVKLTSTVVPKLGDAVRLDIVSVLAANDADGAQRMLAKHKLSNLERLDLLAAVFVELGKRDDAEAINAIALGADHGANHAESCRRLTRAVVLSSPDTRDQPLAALGDLATQDKPDPQCVALYPEVACWVFINREHISGFMGLLGRCAPYWIALQVTPSEQVALETYAAWPDDPSGFDTWYDIANRASRALEIEGADQIATTALEGAVRSQQCTGAGIRELQKLAQRILDEPARKKTVDDARLRRIIDTPATLCAP